MVMLLISYLIPKNNNSTQVVSLTILVDLYSMDSQSLVRLRLTLSLSSVILHRHRIPLNETQVSNNNILIHVSIFLLFLPCMVHPWFLQGILTSVGLSA